MAIVLHLLDEQGHFEQLDSDYLHLYPHIILERDQDKLVTLSEEQAEALASLEGIIRFVDGKFEVEKQTVEISLENAKQALLSKISAKTDRLKEVLTGNYPQTEIDSFYRQEQEARAFLAGENSTPEMLTSIAKIRNLPLEILAQAVVRKADKLASVIGEILGQKQLLETKADNAKTLKALAKIEKEVEQWTL